MKLKHVCLCVGLVCIGMGCVAAGANETVIADFEGADYGSWKTTGTAFGRGPAHGTLPGQMHVEGFVGKGLVNSFLGGDDATGRLSSPEFKIQRPFITFLIGGGGWVDETCLNLVVDGKVVRTATGRNTDGGGSERLEPLAWDVGDLAGRMATLVIVDDRKGGWGHINVDQIVQADARGAIAIAAPPVPEATHVTREVRIEKQWLQFPIKNGAKKRIVTVRAAGEPVRRFDIELADAEPDWWAPLDMSAWIGKSVSVEANRLPVDSLALELLRQTDRVDHGDALYREPLRPQLHFSAQRGWLNDPNGLVFYGGEYHLFFQHNPYGTGWGNMHWGHATSSDLVHWQEHGETLYPDDLGPMFSGSAVVDWNNTSGLGSAGKPPLVLIYTAAGNPTTQCIAYSTDGRHFAKFSGNPVIKQITGGNRDPKVLWHEPTQHWVMVLYVELPGKKHTVHFFRSPNLRDWTLASIIEGGTDNDKYLFECPDFFELPVDGDSSHKKWVLTAANSQYAVGQFDGVQFTPEATKLTDVRGLGYYAAQTFSDIPPRDRRRIQIGWCQAPSPGMPFNQAQSIPSDLTLRRHAEGVRLHRQPVQELALLREGPNQADVLADFRGELIELRADIEPGDCETIELVVRGAKIAYYPKRQELVTNGHAAPAPVVDGRQRVTVFVDRTLLEVFASDGLTYVPMPFIPKADDQSVSIHDTDAQGRKAKRVSLQVYKLKSLWQPAVK